METFVSKDSKLYQNYDHLYLNIFGTESIVVMVEGNDVKSADLMKAVDRLDHQLQSTEGVVGITGPSSVITGLWKITHNWHSNVPHGSHICVSGHSLHI